MLIAAVGLTIVFGFDLPSRVATFAENFQSNQTRHHIPYESWLRADSKGPLIARAFANQVSLARIASKSRMTNSERQLAAIQNGVASRAFIPLYVGVFGRGSEDCPSWITWSSATADYSKALFDFAKRILPDEDVVRLVNLVKGADSDLIRLLDVLVELGENASSAAPSGTLPSDAVAFEVKMWICDARY